MKTQNKNQEERDIFDVSLGNLKVLEVIPYMMLSPKYRKELRRLALEFIFNNK
jgi:hypothetical protein